MTRHEAITEELTQYYAFDTQPSDDYITLADLNRHVTQICRMCGWKDLYYTNNDVGFEYSALTDDMRMFIKNIFPVSVAQSVGGDDMDVCHMRKTSYGRKASITRSSRNVALKERARKIENLVA